MSKKPNTKGGRLSSPRKQAEKSVGAKKGIVICNVCDIFYYKKTWKLDAHSFLAKRENKNLASSYAICPACAMIKDGRYSGRLVIKNIPDGQKADLLNLIKGFCDRAFERDPLSRLIDILQDGQLLVVTVTDKQLAQRLAKKIKDAFNKVNLSIASGNAPGDPVNITVEFLEK